MAAFTFEKSGKSLDGDRLVSGVNPTARWTMPWLILLIIVLIATNLLLVASAAQQPSDQSCSKQLSVWSPLVPVVEYEEHDFVNDFAQESKYRGPPTRAIEEEWARIAIIGALPIPADKLPLLNRSISYPWRRIPEDQGIPRSSSSYQGMIEVFHQLHCLNIIRQYTWADYFRRHPNRVDMPIFMQHTEVASRMHADHCIKSLRLALMCTADIKPSLIASDEKTPSEPKLDISAHHKCRRFESLVDYMKENAV